MKRLEPLSATPSDSSAQPRDPSQLSAGDNAAIGFATGVLAAVLTEPLDVIKTRLMTQRAGRGEGSFGYAGVLHGLRQAARSEGVLSLWKGLAPRLLIKGLGSTIWYTAYMEARRVFSRVGAAARSSSERSLA